MGNLEICCAIACSFDGLSMLAMFCGIKSGLSYIVKYVVLVDLHLIIIVQHRPSCDTRKYSPFPLKLVLLPTTSFF